MPVPQGQARGTVTPAPEARHGGGDWDSHSSDVAPAPVRREAPSPLELSHRRADHQAAAKPVNAEEVYLVKALCSTCSKSVFRHVELKQEEAGSYLSIGLWSHTYWDNTHKVDRVIPKREILESPGVEPRAWTR